MSSEAWLQEQVESLIALFNQGQFKDVIKQGAELAQQFPDIAILYNITGSANTELKRFDAAIFDFSRALQIEPEYAEAYCNLGNASIEAGDLKSALECFHRAITLKPNYLEAYGNLGNAQKELGNYSAAVESYQTAVALNPKLADVHFNLGLALKGMGEAESAILSYQRAIELRPEFVEAHSNLGNALQKIGNSEAAIESYNRAINIRPTYSEAHYNLGICNKSLRNFDSARENFETAGTSKSFAEVLYCLYALGRYDRFVEKINEHYDLYKVDRRVAAISAFFSNQTKYNDPHKFCPDSLNFIGYGQLSDHVEDQNEFIDDLERELSEIPGLWEPDGNTTQRGFQTTGNLFVEQSDRIVQLKQIIEQQIKNYQEEFSSSDCLMMKLWPEETAITGWSVRLQKSGFQGPHIHPSGWLSGVVYLKLVDSENRDEGAIEFGLSDFIAPTHNVELPISLHRPSKGEIILFPSSLYHRTIPIENVGERIIVAFDLVPI